MFNITSEYRRFKTRGKRTKNVAHNYYNLIPYHQEMIGKENSYMQRCNLVYSCRCMV